MISLICPNCAWPNTVDGFLPGMEISVTCQWCGTPLKTVLNAERKKKPKDNMAEVQPK